jgi:GNAT superfamily N-acetyltransferase
MKLITEISTITNAYNQIKNYKKTFNTNFYITTDQINKLILNKLLYEITIGEAFFLIKKNVNFSNLYYYSSSFNELAKSLPLLLKIFSEETLVVDLLSKNDKCPEKILFEQNHFSLYTSLIRMSCIGKKNQNLGLSSKNVRSATNEDMEVVKKLLYLYFDPFAEQLPDTDDLLNWVNNNRVIVFEEQGNILGFIIYDLKASTLFLRYWFVHPKYRDRKIGSHLFNEFLFRGRETHRQMFWVIKSNVNAIKRYLHYGFREEIMYNFVFINKPLKYEN